MIIPHVDSRLCSLDYLARRIGIPPATLRQLADEGRLPHVRVGRTYLVDAEAVQAALFELTHQTPAQPDGPEAKRGREDRRGPKP